MISRSLALVRTAALMSAGCLCIPALVTAAVNYKTGFEQPAYAPGPVAGQDGWGPIGPPSATLVQRAVVKSGSQAVSIQMTGVSGLFGTGRTLAINSSLYPGQVFVLGVDAYITSADKPSWWTVLNASFDNGHTEINIDLSGQITLYNGAKGFNSGLYIAHNQWVHFDLLLDLSNQTESVYYNGVLAIDAAPLGAPARILASSAFYSQLAGTDTGYFDNYTVSLRPMLRLSQSGFTFQAVQGGGNPSPAVFGILNASEDPWDYSLTTLTVSGGSGWLSASPASGVAPPGQPTSVTVSVNPANLSPRDYYGQIRVDVPAAANSPQFVSVVLNVSGSTVNPGPVIQPTGLVFVGLLNGSNPAARPFTVTNLTNRLTGFTATGIAAGTQNWFTISPVSGVVAPNQPATVSVQPRLSGLQAGVYRGSVVIQFAQDNSSRSVDLLLVVTAALNASAGGSVGLRLPAAATCKPTRLLLVFTLLGDKFTTSVAWPTPIEVLVVDDCGSPLSAGSVIATFSNGDPPLALGPFGDGRWSGTWAAVNPRSSSLIVTVTAKSPDQALQGTAQVGGAAQANPDVPSVYPKGVVSAASFAATASPSPGELVSIFGTALADGTEQVAAVPLPSQLQGATLSLGGKPLPLLFTSSGQINAQIPYDIPPGTIQQLVVQRGARLSVPQPVAIAGSEPAIFSTDATGRGQAHIYIVPSPGVQILAEPSSPAKAGDVLQIYGTGLGAVTPPVVTGAATPADAVRWSAPVAVTIGGIAARVVFGGLTPGYVGLYQINATVPSGVARGSEVPVVVTVGASQSSPVTMAVR